MDTIEDIILTCGRRGISSLRPFLPADYCGKAADFVLRHPGTACIVTGFFADTVGFPETDGPPGALAVGRALGRLGYRIYYVTDRFSAPLLQTITGDDRCVITFPMDDDKGSERCARDLLNRLAPTVLIAVERCGRTAEGSYLNIHGRDISPFNARIDYLFHQHDRTIGIGDGGNEIGMGNIAREMRSAPGLPKMPCATRTARLVIASVSNWGAYGLVAAVSRVVRCDLLPEEKEEEALIARMVEAGAVDGISGERAHTVDGFTLEENSRIISQLRLLLL